MHDDIGLHWLFGFGHGGIGILMWAAIFGLLVWMLKNIGKDK